MWWTDVRDLGVAAASVVRDISPGADVSPDARIHGNVVIGAGTRVCAGAVIHGPVRIGRDCLIGNNTLIRGNTVIGDRCSIGFSSELKHARLGDNVSIGPQCFVADSRVDDAAYLGALVRTSNHRLDACTVKVLHDGALLDTGMEKLGAWIGAHAALGVGVIVLPGRIVAPHTQLGPRITVEKNLPAGRYQLAQQLHLIPPLE
jgi:bifunctional UDP-N-acetylglucosamine pyrophosphorylase/glucosamine-1-phosphate N-acetyltransferase